MTARMLQVRMVTNLPSLPSISSYHPQSQTKKKESFSLRITGKRNSLPCLGGTKKGGLLLSRIASQYHLCRRASVFIWLFGLENNFYMQTGLIMIIRLLSKTAILLTEYAGRRRSEGVTLSQVACSVAKARLHPIMMTSLSIVFGLIPLVTAHGVGANGSRSLATGVIGGMTVGTLALLFLVPSLFTIFQLLVSGKHVIALIPSGFVHGQALFWASQVRCPVKRALLLKHPPTYKRMNFVRMAI